MLIIVIIQMVASIAAVNDPFESQKQLELLQEENLLLKQQLSKSMTSLISNGKVSVTSAEKGDIVLVIWSEEHANYQIYHEVSECIYSVMIALSARALVSTSYTQRACRGWG